MATSADDITAALRAVADERLAIPYGGQWCTEAVLDPAGHPVLANDDEHSRIIVDKGTGAVLLADAEGSSVLNSTLAAFLESARRYSIALDEADTVDDGDEEADEQYKELEERLLAHLRDIDPAAVDSDLWALGAEEIGLGVMSGRPDTAPPPQHRPGPS